MQTDRVICGDYQLWLLTGGRGSRLNETHSFESGITPTPNMGGQPGVQVREEEEESRGFKFVFRIKAPLLTHFFVLTIHLHPLLLNCGYPSPMTRRWRMPVP